MTSILLSIAAVLAVSGMCCRPPSPDDTTISQVWAPARANGWRKSTLLAVAGLLLLLLLVAAGLAIVACRFAGHIGRGAGLGFAAISWHLAGVATLAAAGRPQAVTAGQGSA